jgi:hypothetical protein
MGAHQLYSYFFWILRPFLYLISIYIYIYNLACYDSIKEVHEDQKRKTNFILLLILNDTHIINSLIKYDLDK